MTGRSSVTSCARSTCGMRISPKFARSGTSRARSSGPSSPGETHFLMSRPSGVADPEGPAVFFTRCLGGSMTRNVGIRTTSRTKSASRRNGMLTGATAANLSAPARAWLDASRSAGSRHRWRGRGRALASRARHYLFAQYLGDNADGVAIDWPRIPLPDQRERLDSSARLGADIAALLDTEADVPGVTSGAVAEHLRVLGVISGTDLSVKAGWGNRDSKGRINPGRGRRRHGIGPMPKRRPCARVSSPRKSKSREASCCLDVRSMCISTRRPSGAVCPRRRGTT